MPFDHIREQSGTAHTAVQEGSTESIKNRNESSKSPEKNVEQRLQELSDRLAENGALLSGSREMISDMKQEIRNMREHGEDPGEEEAQLQSYLSDLEAAQVEQQAITAELNLLRQPGASSIDIMGEELNRAYKNNDQEAINRLEEDLSKKYASENIQMSEYGAKLEERETQEQKRHDRAISALAEKGRQEEGAERASKEAEARSKEIQRLDQQIEAVEKQTEAGINAEIDSYLSSIQNEKARTRAEEAVARARASEKQGDGRLQDLIAAVNSVQDISYINDYYTPDELDLERQYKEQSKTDKMTEMINEQKAAVYAEYKRVNPMPKADEARDAWERWLAPVSKLEEQAEKSIIEKTKELGSKVNAIWERARNSPKYDQVREGYQQRFGMNGSVNELLLKRRGDLAQLRFQKQRLEEGT